jgi:leucyl-tRNA synthetase
MPLRQWMLRITAYADRLLEDLEPLDWSPSIKKNQRDWIGRSEGAEVEFRLAQPVTGKAEAVRVFTTRPDTLFGATYMVLAPEHPLVAGITTAAQREAVLAYHAAAARKSDRERTDEGKKKTGVFTGAQAINPVNQEAIPIWIADYVLATYGTGAIMAVPAHDVRDFEFARQFNLPIRAVVKPSEQWLKETGSTLDQLQAAYTGAGKAIHSGQFDGLPTEEFKARILEWLEEHNVGARRVNYKLRDWLFSRQRYWGEPFPILHELNDKGEPTGVLEALTPEELPLLLPALADYKPSGRPEPPLGKATDWVNVTRNGKRYRRETNTMPQWAGSCWYYLRYIDPKNSKTFCDPDLMKRWMPVDLYVGGAEHAVLHLLYSRFWHKVLFDRGHVNTPEPFQKLVNQGMILGDVDYHVKPEVYDRNRAVFEERGLQVVELKEEEKTIYILRNPAEGDRFAPLTEDQVVREKGRSFLKGTQIELIGQAEKMSKSRKNVVNPDDVVREYGADSLRLYEMFMGPLEAVKPWSTRGVEGVYRFLGRVWRLIIDDKSETMQCNEGVQDVELVGETLRQLHKTVRRVTDDLDNMRFNTAIAALMEFSNFLTPLPVRPRHALEMLVLLLSPLAPHIAEELWQALGHTKSLAYEPWPTYDPALCQEDEIEVPVQINGKLKARLTVPADIDEATLRGKALADERVQEQIAGKQVKKMIIVPRKLVNIVVG